MQLKSLLCDYDMKGKIYLCSIQFYPLYTHRKAFNICWETHESGYGSESNACPDTWMGDGVAFTSSLQTSPLCSLNLRGCHGDFEPKKLDTYLSFYDMQQQIWDVQVLVLLGTCCFSYGSEWYFLTFMHLHINITVFRYN